MKHLIISITILLFGLNLNAQQATKSVSGTIHEQATKEPIIYATVKVKDAPTNY